MGDLRPSQERPLALWPIAGRGTLTDNRGYFRIEGITGPETTLELVMLGYSPAIRTVSVGETDLRFLMSSRVIELDAVVVTGTAGG